MMLPVYLSLLLLAGVCSHLVSRQNSNLIPLSADVTDDIDLEARRQLLFLIVEKMNDTVIAQSAVVKECEHKINQTATECIACQNDQCSPSVPLDQAIVGILQAGVNYPIVYAGKGIEEMGQWFAGTPSWMGKRAGEYSNSISSTANTVGKSLENSANQAIATLGHTFGDIATTFKGIGDAIGSDLTNDLQSLGNLDQILGNAFSNVQSGFNNLISNIGSGISDVASDFWKNTFGQLGRKKRSIKSRLQLRAELERFLARRCTSSCPTCDNLDTDKYTTEEITEKICGADTVESTNEAISDVTWLQGLYNKTISEQLISSIEFDRTTMNFVDGSLVFTDSYYTINGETTKLGGNLDSFDTAKNGKAIADEYFASLWNNSR